MKTLLFLSLASLTLACGKKESGESTVTPTYSLVDGQNLKWGDGGLVLNEEQLVLFTSYLPEGEAGKATLPLCAELDPEMTIGQFTCNTDNSTQDIKVKHVKQICQIGGPEAKAQVTAATANLDASKCSSGRVKPIAIDMKLGYGIQKK